MSNHKSHPLTKFHFKVEWGGTKIGFTEVSGLDFETQVIEYREGSDIGNHKRKQPGLVKYSNVTLKRGTFQGDTEFFDWWKMIFQEDFRRDLTISALNKQHEPIITWKLRNAWPCKVQSTDLKASGNEAAIETIELVHEGLSVESN